MTQRPDARSRILLFDGGYDAQDAHGPANKKPRLEHDEQAPNTTTSSSSPLSPNQRL